MQSPKRIVSTQYPSVIQKLGDGTYYYNYDIQNTTVQEDDTLKDAYSYIQAHIQGNPNYTDCVKAIIRQYLSIDEEFDLINSYNSYQATLVDDETIATSYLDYLNLLQTIKKKIKEDFK